MREINFSYILQHQETGMMVDVIFNLSEIENGLFGKMISKGGLYERYGLLSVRRPVEHKDKNGIDVYEGDILTHGKHKLLCVFEQGCFQFECRIGEHSGLSMTFRDHSSYEFEIIGNRFQNPELIPEQL